MKKTNRDIYKSIKTTPITILTTLLAFLALLLYFYNFRGSFSKDPHSWGAFGSYLNGTIGTLAAITAVIWLIISVNLQKKELEHVKAQLEKSAEEQIKQTTISAISAILNSSLQLINNYQNDLVALNNGEKHLHPFADAQHLHNKIDMEWRKMIFYQAKIESYLNDKYIDKSNENSEGDEPF